MPPKLTKEIITAAIEGFEEQKRRIDAQIAELRGEVSGAQTEPAAETATKRPRRKMSAAARKKIAEAQRKRWAAAKGESEVKAPTKPKRVLSAQGRANIIAALKKRYAAKKAAKK